MFLVAILAGGCEARGTQVAGGGLRDESDGGEGAGGGICDVPARRLSASEVLDEVVDR